MKMLMSIFLMKINFVGKSKEPGLRKRSPRPLILIEMRPADSCRGSGEGWEVERLEVKL